MEGYNVIRYTPTKEIHERYKDGGVAIIDQIIASHARYIPHYNMVVTCMTGLVLAKAY